MAHETRLATADDAAEVSRVLALAFEPLRSLYTPEAIAYTVGSQSTARTRIAEGPLWLVFDGLAAVGTASVMAMGSRAYLRGMAVVPEAQGQGAGAILMKHVLAYALETRMASVFLHTTPFLHSAIHLYEKFGFIRTNEGPHDLYGTPLFTMEVVF